MLSLINPDEKVYDKNRTILGSRVCYFYEESFDVAEPLFFVSVSDENLSKDPQFFYYDENDQTVKEILEENLPETLTNPVNNEPSPVEDLVQKLLEKKLFD
jgi:hypothetical protein